MITASSKPSSSWSIDPMRCTKLGTPNEDGFVDKATKLSQAHLTKMSLHVDNLLRIVTRRFHLSNLIRILLDSLYQAIITCNGYSAIIVKMGHARWQGTDGGTVYKLKLCHASQFTELFWKQIKVIVTFESKACEDIL
eukprot:CAMPEP_0197253042 /NCGR_PEP_ID=MMETSP1429-20130617/63442_1 /TAXON_ID=49237 /ORGANISM="Chaetoceros  sp., Strain UNC1202" /LENGTH=137 /DNA_ID=CAMNT_0042715577 /DNA_START=60 /DNA_END=473 /DNA_ORIENTATION=-